LGPPHGRRCCMARFTQLLSCTSMVAWIVA
jgi:hypothetical protein